MASFYFFLGPNAGCFVHPSPSLVHLIHHILMRSHLCLPVLLHANNQRGLKLRWMHEGVPLYWKPLTNCLQESDSGFDVCARAFLSKQEGDRTGTLNPTVSVGWHQAIERAAADSVP